MLGITSNIMLGITLKLC